MVFILQRNRPTFIGIIGYSMAVSIMMFMGVVTGILTLHTMWILANSIAKLVFNYPALCLNTCYCMIVSYAYLKLTIAYKRLHKRQILTVSIMQAMLAFGEYQHILACAQDNQNKELNRNLHIVTKKSNHAYARIRMNMRMNKKKKNNDI